MGPLLLFNALEPETRERVAMTLASLGETRIEAYAIGLLTILSMIVIGAALVRFRRGKLVLD